MDDEHWTTDMVPERTFCIHENGLPNNVCQYPCPYGNNNESVSYMDSLDLSDISDYKDYMLTTSDDEDLPGLEEVPYWTLVCFNTYLTFKLQWVALNFVCYHLNTWLRYLLEHLTWHFFFIQISCTYSCMLSFKDNYFLFNYHHFFFIIIIIIIFFSFIVFFFNFVHTWMISHRSILKYKKIISETWCFFHQSLSGCGTGSLETCTHIISRPKTYYYSFLLLKLILLLLLLLLLFLFSPWPCETL